VTIDYLFIIVNKFACQQIKSGLDIEKRKLRGEKKVEFFFDVM